MKKSIQSVHCTIASQRSQFELGKEAVRRVEGVDSRTGRRPRNEIGRARQLSSDSGGEVAIGANAD